ncbi:hypothetical protein MHYP_G00287110 [Metynnis hypsauchen]
MGQCPAIRAQDRGIQAKPRQCPRGCAINACLHVPAWTWPSRPFQKGGGGLLSEDQSGRTMAAVALRKA